MGAQNSTPPSPKLTLAEKRYRVNGLRRKSTRKSGNTSGSGANLEVSPSARSFEGLESVVKVSAAPAADDMRPSVDIDARLIALYPEQFAAQKTAPKRQEWGGGRGMRRHAASTPTPFCRIGAGDRPANQILITRTQRVLIENSWRRCRKTGSDGVGSRIFISVLTAQPDIKLLFGLEKIPQGRLKYDPPFRKHASVLTRTLDYIVKNLAYTDKLCQHFNALGRKHFQLPGRARFQEQYWDVFAEAFAVVIVESGGDAFGHRCRETSAAWRCLIAFIIKQMRRGYYEKRNARKRFSASLMGAPPPAATAAVRANSTVDVLMRPSPGSRHSIRKLSDFRVASLSAIPALPTSANTLTGNGMISLSLTTSRAPLLTGANNSSAVASTARVRTPSINSTASALVLPTQASAGVGPMAASSIELNSEIRDDKSLLLSLSEQQQSQQQRSASWCSDCQPFEDQQRVLNALAKAMRQQASLNRTDSEDEEATFFTSPGSAAGISARRCS